MQIFKKVKNKIFISTKVAKLGETFIDKIFIFFISFFLSILNKLGIKNKKNIKLRLKFLNKNFNFLIQSPMDLVVLHEVFVDEEYKLDFDIPKIIFDLGSNIGATVIYFKIKYPDAKIYAFEPDPRNFSILKKNITQFTDIITFNVAVSWKNEKLKLYTNPDMPLSSSLKKRELSKGFVEVEGKTLDSIIRELNVNHVDLLKFDIEGGEYDVFKNCQNLKMIKNIIGEVHLDLINVSHSDFLNLFKPDFIIDEKEISSERFIISLKSKSR